MVNAWQDLHYQELIDTLQPISSEYVVVWYESASTVQVTNKLLRKPLLLIL